MAALGGLILYATLAGAQSSSPDTAAHLLLVPDDTGAQATLSRSDVRVVADYEDFTLVSAHGQDFADLRSAGAVRRDDLSEVSLPGTVGFDPLTDRDSLAAKGRPEPGEALVLVQFAGPIKGPWLELLRSTGARVVEYVAQNGYVVHAVGAEVDRLAALVGTNPAVRAVTRVTAADKVSDEVARGSGLVAVQTIAGAEGAEARREAAAAGAPARSSSDGGGLATQYLRLSADEIEALAADPAVVSVTPYSLPVLADERASQIVAGNLSGFGPAAAGYLAWHDGGPGTFAGPTFNFVVDVTDEGIDNGSATAPGHPDFRENGTAAGASRIAYNEDYTTDPSSADCGGHGTNVASIAAGYNTQADAPTPNNYNDSDGYNYGLGVAPRAQVGGSKVFACNGVFNPTSDLDQVASNAHEDGARISNNSWGNQDRGAYSPDSQDFDRLVRDARSTVAGNQELVEVFAAGNTGDRETGAGNEGYGTINSPGTAKNVITVGASENVRAFGGTDGCGVSDAASNNARDLLDFSSRGPTDDLRMKPDLVAPGTHMAGASPQHPGYAGASTCAESFPTGNPFYSLISGTSQATAAVSGAAALVRDDFTDDRGIPPSPAMTKALLINSATDLAGGSNGKGAVTAGAPNADQGWGRVNAGAAVGTTPRQYVDQTSVFGAPGASYRRGYGIVNPSQPVKVTLAWTDPPAAVGPGPSLVNDLDLVVAAGGRRYLGNVLTGGASRTGGTPDTRNNVESVILPAGFSGRFSIKVGATNVPGDGVPGNGDTTDQDFALVVSNASAPSSWPQLTADQASTSDAGAGADHDGALEPGEAVSISSTVRNEGAATATGVSGTFSGAGGLTVTRGGSAFANAAPGATTTSQSAFAGTLSAAATCGADVPATLSLTTAGNPPQSVPLALGTGAAGPVTSTSSGTVSRAIPDDNSGGTESSLNVSGSGRIKDVDVVIGGIAHTWVGDLALELRHPDGTTVELARHPGGPDNLGDNLRSTIFDDEAALNISQGAAPYTGRFRPQNDQLSRLDGKDKQGVWTLRVKDLFEGQAGALLSWGVNISSAVCNYSSGAGPASPASAPSFALSPVAERPADVAAGRLTVLGACAAACRATAKLTVSGKLARSIGLTKKAGRRPVSLGSGSDGRRSAGPLRWRVKLGRRGRAALRGEKRLSAKLAVAITVTGARRVKYSHTVDLRASAGLATIARRGLPLRAACSSRCPLAVALWLDARTARRLGLKTKGAKRIRVASKRPTVSTRGSKLTLKMARSARAAAARQKRLSARLTAVAGPSSGPTRKADRTLSLRR